MKLKLSGSRAIQLMLNIRSFFIWVLNQFESPSPQFVKQRVLVRNGIMNGTWIETGTFLGSTTRILAKKGNKVISIEPQKDLFEYNSRKFKRKSNITMVHGTSEDELPRLLPSVSGSINFWLDGHYSDGITFRGESETPIKLELKAIEDLLGKSIKIAIFVDDIRCFNPDNPMFAGYPPLDFLVDWAKSNGFKWAIEQDIFIAKR